MLSSACTIRHAAMASVALLIGLLALTPGALAQRAARSAAIAAPTAFVAPRGANVVTVVTHDFAFDMPASIPAGLTTFRLSDHGKQHHHLSIVRLDSGKTTADGLAALITAGHGLRPAWMHPVGGPNAVMPGAEGYATLELEPGNYLAFCEVPGPEPKPHFMNGMAKGFTVEPSANHAALPGAELTLTLSDYAFTFSRPLTSGHHSIAVTNAARQPHMVVITRLFPGKSTRDFIAWAQAPKGKPAPGEALGGATEMAPGDTVVIEGDFPPGHYGLLCFTADEKDGKPHFMHGMQREFDVQ